MRIYRFSLSPCSLIELCDTDMLEVGHPPGGTGEARSFANTQSWRAHFGAWAITSSPLILSFDLSNETLLNMTWDFIANPEVLRVNSDWAGEAGRLLSSTYDTSAPTPSFARPCTSSLDTQHFVLHPNGQIRSLAPGDGRCLSVPSCPTTTYDKHEAKNILLIVSSITKINQIHTKALPLPPVSTLVSYY